MAFFHQKGVIWQELYLYYVCNVILILDMLPFAFELNLNSDLGEDCLSSFFGIRLVEYLGKANARSKSMENAKEEPMIVNRRIILMFIFLDCEKQNIDFTF